MDKKRLGRILRVGLNAKGRASYKGGTLKAPVKSGDNPRRASFLARMAGMRGPEKDAKGNLLGYYYRFVHGVLQVRLMLVQKLEQYRNETSQRKRLDEIHLKVELLRYKLKERKAKNANGKRNIRNY